MHVRRPWSADVPDGEPHPAAKDDPAVESDPVESDPVESPEIDLAELAAARGEVTFTVPAKVVMAKFGLAALVALLAVTAGNRPQVMIGLVAAVGLISYAGRDVLARQRLRADRDGVVAARGYAGRSRLPWAQIEHVRIDSRSRFAATTPLLEIDAGTEILLFSRYDLGVEPVDAAAALAVLRSGTAGPGSAAGIRA